MKLSMLLVISSMAFAAYGPASSKVYTNKSNWILGLGYGKMFSMKETDNGEKHKLDNPAILELDLFNKNGFGAVYMTNAGTKGFIADGNLQPGDYSFNAYFMGYQRRVASDVSLRGLMGMSKQKFITNTNAASESDNQFAYSISLSKHFHMSNFCSFVELGYLGQEDFAFNPANQQDKIAGSGAYIKLGIKTSI